ncbi:DNA (cytosine-5)-methyltransferase 1 [Acorus calamus]|uniref:DNA (cytosine-5-)-methyltransferase n=1 Tax=Acorus calamus TaxID=4465 RepID=A0AAV9CM84_ACOCL|nr:DNA (cytosine-5)-methyltransferase 1 [Acorus calamus]
MAGSDLDLEEMDGVDDGEEELAMEAAEETVEEERRRPCKTEGAEKEEEVVCRFIGAPVKESWPHRYNNEKWFDKGSLCSIVKRSFETAKDPIVKAMHYFYEAEVENCIYRLDDDVYVAIIKGKHVSNHEEKRVFISEVKDDNLLKCISRKVTIVQVSPDVDLVAKASKIPPCDLYYDMSYSPDFSIFAKIPSDEPEVLSGSSSTVSSPIEVALSKDETQSNERRELTLLDIFSGCGAMSTGLCLWANESGLKLVTVRNEKAGHFLLLLKEWQKLCTDRNLIGSAQAFGDIPTNNDDNSDILEASQKDSSPDSEEFEVQKLIDICYGDQTNVGKDGLMFKGDADVICEGPPCQGMSGFNRFRQAADPMKDKKNNQQNVVGYLRDQQYELQRPIVLEDAISDLPPVTDDEWRDEMRYLDDPKTDLQFKIRALKDGCNLHSKLYDHRPLQLNEDDYLRVCQIPKHKIIVHPLQDRVLTIRENARLQGFPDWYKLFGPIKERYIQVGKAVAVPVAQGLGYALGMAVKGLNNEGHVMTLPKNFSTLQRTESSSELEEVNLN